MNLPRFIPDLESMVPLRLRDGEVRIDSSGFTDASRPHWLTLGPALLMLTGEEAIAVGSALIQAEHHRRAVLAQYQVAGDAGEAVPA